MARPRLHLAAWLAAVLVLLLPTPASSQYVATEPAKDSDDENHCVMDDVPRDCSLTTLFISWAGVTVDHVLRPALLNRVTSIGSLILMIVGHVLRVKFGADFPQTHTFLVHLFILNNFYSKRSLSKAFTEYIGYHRMPFITSAVFLVLDALVRGVIVSRLDADSSTRKHKSSDLVVVNRYMQVSAPFGRCCLYFLGQFSLVMIFIYELDRDKETKQACNVSFFKWFVASILTIVAGHSEVGMDYRPRFWQELFQRAEGEEQGYVFACWMAKHRRIWKVRRAFSFMVNNIFRMLILGMCPTMLCVSHSMEFIKDCLAVFFITKLDDVDGGGTLDEEVTRLKELSSRDFDVLAAEEAEKGESADATPLMDEPNLAEQKASREE